LTYPKYPTLESRPTPAGTYPKDSLESLEAAYRLLTGVGLYVLPKRRSMKVPLQDYWRKVDPVIMTSVEQAMNEQKRKDVSGWCVATGSRSGRLIVLDLDPSEIIRNGNSPQQVYMDIQSLAPTSFVIGTPAGGVHLYYHVAEKFTLTGNDAPPIKGVDLRGEGGQVVSLGGYNRYDDEYAQDKGMVNGHTASYRLLPDADYRNLGEANEALVHWLGTKKREAAANKAAGENYSETLEGHERINTHNLRPQNEKEALTLECLGFILRKWDGHVERHDWLQMWMSAWHASDGSNTIRDFILGHPNIYWSDGKDGFGKFRSDWANHKPTNDGFTVSSLFWLAKKAGWLTKTGYEIPDEVFERIKVKYVADWLDSLEQVPSHVLLQSQTGSGKTYGFSKLYERLGRPKSVIFVPSIKLAIELGSTLEREHRLPVTIYRDTDTLTQVEVETLREADILVTTLQSFAIRLAPDMADYGLVYLEESDQLLAQFSRGGGGIASSHVSDKEARAGFQLIADAYKNSGAVWMVDATMSRVSYETAVALCPVAPRVILNEEISDKAITYFVDTKGEAYQEVMEVLKENKQVVIAADTVNSAHEAYDTMREIFPNKSMLVITRKTARTHAVAQFMQDINNESAKYDLVVYNSVMASGVSITSTRPALVVQICSYLTPRNNLQLLNRYRKQQRVVVWYQKREALYNDTDKAIYDNAFDAATLEAQMVRLPLVTRETLAALRSRIAAISVADEQAQKRSVVPFYQALVAGDGRIVVDAQGDVPTERLQHTIDGVRAARKERAEEIAQLWPTIDPIDENHPADPSFDDFTVTLGEAHAEVLRVLKNVPEGVKPEEVWNIVQEFKDRAYIMMAFLRQDESLKKAEAYVLDAGKAVTTMMNNITLFTVVSLSRIVYQNLEEVIDSETYAIRGAEFMKALTPMKEAYNKVVDKRNEFDEVYSKNATDGERAKAFVKILLARIGLKQKSERGKREGEFTSYNYFIANLGQAHKFISWRNPEETLALELGVESITAKLDSREEANKLYEGFDQTQKDRVLYLVRFEAGTNFETAVKTVYLGEW
jgi:hypothetical protein